MSQRRRRAREGWRRKRNTFFNLGAGTGWECECGPREGFFNKRQFENEELMMSKVKGRRDKIMECALSEMEQGGSKVTIRTEPSVEIK